MEKQLEETLKGHFLIAMPGMKDPNFFQSVICICDHTPEGALGIVVNRTHFALSGKNIFSELSMTCKPDSESIPLYIGGPVRIGELYVLHGPPVGWNYTIMVTKKLALRNSGDILQAIALGQGPGFFIISMGCAGWGAGQLENEIRGNVWLTCPADENIIIGVTEQSRWAAVVKSLGIDPTMLSETAGHA